MTIIASKSKKKDLHRRPSAQRTRIINRFQRHEAFSPQTAKTLKQLELQEKKYDSFIENMIAEKIIIPISKSSQKLFYLNLKKVSPKKGDNQVLITTLVFVMVFILLMFIFFFI